LEPQSVIVGFPHGTLVHAFFMTSVFRALELPEFVHDMIQTNSGPMISGARNSIVRHFLSHPAQPHWLLSLDTDMVFGVDEVRTILKHADPDETPILGGLTFAGNARYQFPVILREEGGELRQVHDYPRDTIFECDGTGAAFLLIHRRVFEKVPYPWWHYGQYGEDEWFCERARKHGFPIKVDTSVKIGHVKPVVLNEAWFDHTRQAGFQMQDWVKDVLYE